MISAILMLAQAAPATPPLPAFLTGCWEQRQAERWTEECWTIPRGGMMLGSGRDGRGDKVGHWEWMRIERNAGGVPIFYGSPKGAAPVAFTATAATATEITFVNAAHDYPQRVRYMRSATGIDAEISLADGSKPTRWRYRSLGSPVTK